MFSLSDLDSNLAFAALSAVLMLRKRRATRIICMMVLALTTAGVLLSWLAASHPD